MKSQQRVTAAASGGGLSSGQNIMILAEEARKMQMDQLELQRQQDLTLAKGKSQAALLKQQGKNANTASILNGVSSGVGAYSAAGGTFGGGGSKGTASKQMTMKSDAPSSVKTKYGW